MNAKELARNYQDKKHIFHEYIDNIKKNSNWNLYTIINPALIKNPYSTSFVYKFFKNEVPNSNKFLLFLKNICKFYAKNLYMFCSYIVAIVLYKIYYKKNKNLKLNTIIDIFGLVDKTNKSGKFEENYFQNLYDVLEKYNKNYTILLRPYAVGKNPFKLIKFFKIISQDKKDFIFEYEFLKFADFARIFTIIIFYPFRVLKLRQKEKSDYDKIFNYCLVEDIIFFNFSSIARYILGKNLAKIKSIETIYSWSEFQIIERSFNYAIRKNNPNIKIIACQFYLNYEVYFNAFADDIDYEMLSSPHIILVNGMHYIKDRSKLIYKSGVSLRYKNIFEFEGIGEEKNILILGSYLIQDTKTILKNTKKLKNIIFKNHPAVDIKKIKNLLLGVEVSDKSIYELFKNSSLVITSASGSAVEAVACEVSVIIVASKDFLTANPLLEKGKGQIWDIAYDENDIILIHDKLIAYRKTNLDKIKKIATWYKENLFIEPTEENIVKAFKIKKGIVG